MAKRNAFTLIEMLVVVTIIGMMAMVAIWSFGNARRAAQIDVGIDSLVSVFKEQQSLARSGRVTTVVDDVESVDLCYGIHVSKAEPYVQRVEAPYVAVNEQRTEVDFCDMSNSMTREAGFIRGLEVREIEQFQLEQEELVVMYKPPFGRPVFGDLSSVEVQEFINSPLILIEIAVPDEDIERSLRYNVVSGLIERFDE